MIIFFIVIALLVVAALVAIIPSALKSASKTQLAQLDQLETNISIAKDRQADLRSSLDSGAISQTTYDTELADVENALALDLNTKQQDHDTARGGWLIAACIALFLPIASGAMYLRLGTPNAVNTQTMHLQAVDARNEAAAQSEAAPAALTELLPNLEKKLEANPEDRDGWLLLGKSYLSIGEFSNAKRALLKAYDLNAEDPDLLVQLAEASAMEIGGDLSGEAGEYIDSALAINPAHQPSLWLKAIASKQAGQHEDAIAQLEALRPGVIDNPEAIASIDQLIGESKKELGLPVEPVASTATANNAANTTSAATTSVSLNVTVTLPDDVLEKVDSSDAVFIFARASSGPPMPLAVSRHVVSDLPVTVVLDDSMAMMPAMTLSQYPSVTVGARVSPSGNAIAQPGDWYAEQENVLPADINELTLTIDKQK